MNFVRTFVRVSVNPRIHIRTFKVTSTCFKKIFRETENETAYQVLKDLNINTIIKENDIDRLLVKFDINVASNFLDKNWHTVSIDDLMQGLFDVVSYCRKTEVQISDTKFDSIVDAITERRYEFTDNQLMDLLKSLMILPETPTKHTRNFWDIWLAIEEVNVDRMSDVNYPKRFLIADHYYRLNLGRTTHYTYRTLVHFGRHARTLPKDQLLHMIFLLNIMRKPLENMVDVEKNWIKLVDDMSIQENALMCMGFFKTQTRIKDPELVAKLYEKLRENLNTIESIPLVNCLKALRYSSRLNEQYIIMDLLDAIIPEIPRFSLLACIHIILLGSDIQQCHETSLTIVVKRFISELKSARIKDIERVCFVMGLYDFRTSEGIEKKLCEMVCDELQERVDEIAKYPKCLSMTLSYLALIGNGYVTKDLLNICLNPDFLRLAYGKESYYYGREITFLDSYAEIHFENYQGHRLPKKVKDYLCNSTIDYLPDRVKTKKLTKSNQIVLEIYEACDEIFGHCRMYQPLPHFQRPGKLF